MNWRAVNKDKDDADDDVDDRHRHASEKLETNIVSLPRWTKPMVSHR